MKEPSTFGAPQVGTENKTPLERERDLLIEELFNIEEHYIDQHTSAAMTAARGADPQVDIASREMMAQMQRMIVLVRRLGHITQENWSEWFNKRGKFLPRPEDKA